MAAVLPGTRQFCRQKKRVIFTAVLVIAMLVFINSFQKGEFSISLNEDCVNGIADHFIAMLCRNYTKRLAHGHFCLPMCDTKTFRPKSCIKHGDTVVIGGLHNDENIVLKWKRPNWKEQNSVKYYEEKVQDAKNKKIDFVQPWRELITRQVESAINVDFTSLSESETARVFENLGVSFTRDPYILQSYLPLISQDEYAMLGFYQDLKHIPKLHGYCGQAYALEKLTPYNKFFPAIRHKLDWQNTVKIALSFLDMIEELERANGGPLHHCDVQEGNFGITDSFKVKMMDVDMILTKNKADLFLPQPNCTKDSDCDFFDCVSMCNVKRKKCLSKQITSNFQLVCRDIFLSSWPSTSLFGAMPSHIRPLLTPILQDCSSKRFGYLSFDHPKVKSTLRLFRIILSRDLRRNKRIQ